MPNYGLVVTPTYNPISFEDYSKPFQMYTQAYNQMADAYDTLEMEAGQWEKLKNSAQDAEQWAIANQYLNDLRGAAEDLATNGLTPKVRGIVSKLRGRYAKEILPIEQAWKAREEEKKLQTQALLSNPDILFDRDAYTTGLNAYMPGNPEMQSYSGATLREISSKMASNLAREAREEIMKNGKNSGWYHILEKTYYEKALKTGLTADEVMTALVQSVDENGTIHFKEAANPYLEKIFKSVLAQSGLTNWNNWSNDKFRERVLGYIGSGLWSSIGQVDYKNLADRNFKEPGSGSGDSIEVKPPRAVEEWVYSQNQRNLLNKYGHYFTKQTDAEGNTIIDQITNEGLKQLGKVEARVHGTSKPLVGQKTGQMIPRNEEFYNAMLEQARVDNPKITEKEFDTMIDNASGTKVTSPQARIDALRKLTKYYRDVENPNDLTASRRYVFRVKDATSNNLKKAINRALVDLPLQEVDYDPITQGYKTVEERKDKLGKDDVIVATTYSLAGTTVDIDDGSGKIKTYKLPKGIDIVSENNRDISLNKARAIAQRILSNPNLSDIDRTYLMQEYDKAIKEANLYHSQIGFVNDTKSQDYEVFDQ